MKKIWIAFLGIGCLWGLLSGQPSPKKGQCPFKDGVMRHLTDTDYNAVVGTRESTVRIDGTDNRVLAPVDGRVRDVFSVYHNIAIVRDTATYTCYDLDSSLVREGQMVKAGQVIGFASKRRVYFFVSNYLYNKISRSPQDYVDCVCR